LRTGDWLLRRDRCHGGERDQHLVPPGLGFLARGPCDRRRRAVLASVALIVWKRFVGRVPGGDVAVMATDQLARAALILALPG
jgi:hypothetical protein